MILTELMSDEELRYGLANADRKMREATQWGPQMATAEREWKIYQAEIERRQALKKKSA